MLLGVAAAAACSRTALDAELLGAEAGPASCPADAGVTVGTPARTLTARQAGATVIDPDDDLLLVFGGLDASGEAPKIVSGVKLGTGEPVALSRTGDSNVALGPGGRAIWDPINHRAIVVGDSLSFFDPSAPPDLSQVFSARVSGANVELHELPKFPDGETGDVALPAAIDPIARRLLVLPEKPSNVPGPLKVWALDLDHDSWSLFSTDDGEAVQDVLIASITYDATSRRLLGVGNGEMWALSLDAPNAWFRIQGTFPPALAAYSSILGGGMAFVWDDTLCAWVVAFTDGTCLYQVWRADVGATSFAMTSLGLAVQATPRYARGMGMLDARRRNFVFGGAFDCDQHDYVSASTDFLPVTP
jgi:hypothetical protein